ncbi:hypothetical protein NDU88_005845 [Pleurodeles waltl]|uniref:Uncharacterized protein n=1 Tax=Pleurodeles waltl TaxID=8319 RepID=A0AAV7TV39_PLEWA|nr:hypothetical protein NDU88_005845 [Pleurodeles waltl]
MRVFALCTPLFTFCTAVCWERGSPAGQNGGGRHVTRLAPSICPSAASDLKGLKCCAEYVSLCIVHAPVYILNSSSAGTWLSGKTEWRRPSRDPSGSQHLPVRCIRPEGAQVLCVPDAAGHFCVSNEANCRLRGGLYACQEVISVGSQEHSIHWDNRVGRGLWGPVGAVTSDKRESLWDRSQSMRHSPRNVTLAAQLARPLLTHASQQPPKHTHSRSCGCALKRATSQRLKETLS